MRSLFQHVKLELVEPDTDPVSGPQSGVQPELSKTKFGVAASIGFTVSLFFATAACPPGAALAETKMGALLSFVAAPLALFSSTMWHAPAARQG
jgi:hypothetical protein